MGIVSAYPLATSGEPRTCRNSTLFEEFTTSRFSYLAQKAAVRGAEYPFVRLRRRVKAFQPASPGFVPVVMHEARPSHRYQTAELDGTSK